MAKLIVTGADNICREFAIEHALTIGRGSSNHVQLNEEKASRTHCRVRPDGDEFCIEDLNSSNGTKVNGQKVASQKLKHGDMVVIGATTIVFDDAKEAERQREPAPAPARPDGAMTLMLSAEEIAALDKKGGAVAEVPSLKAPADSDAHQLFHPRSALASKPIAATGRQRPVRPRPSALLSALKALASLMVIVVSALLVIKLVKPRESTQVAQNKPQVLNGNGVLPLPPPLPPPPPVPTAPNLPPKKGDSEIELDPEVREEFMRVLSERTQAIGSSNYPRARSVLAQFIAAHPAGELAEKARHELKETEALIATALGDALKRAEEAAEQKNYPLAVQRCTRVLSADGAGKFGTEARQQLTRIDQQTEPRFRQLNEQASSQIQNGQLANASETLVKAMDELIGTKWAESISGSQMQVAMALRLIKLLDSERQKRLIAGKPLELVIASRNLKGTLQKINCLVFEIQSGAGAAAVPLRNMDPAEFMRLLESAGLADRHLELAYLWMLLGQTAAFKTEVERALENPEQAAAAAHLASVATNVRNLKIYDFSKWQHQSDWDVLAGSWATQDNRYLCESPEGGDTTLQTQALGGMYSAKGARIGFDFELGQSRTGFVFSFEFGTEQKCISVMFSADSVTLASNVAGAVSEKGVWKNEPTHVELAIGADKLVLTVNGKALPALSIQGVSSFAGTVSFRARETTCKIDNVILRNVE